MKEKQCKICGIELSEENQVNYGIIVKHPRRYCKVCYKEERRKQKVLDRHHDKRWAKTVSGFLRRKKVNRNKLKRKGLNYRVATPGEIHDKFCNDKNFLRLFTVWAESGYKQELLPMLFRKKNIKDWSVENLEFRLKKAL